MKSQQCIRLLQELMLFYEKDLTEVFNSPVKNLSLKVNFELIKAKDLKVKMWGLKYFGTLPIN